MASNSPGWREEDGPKEDIAAYITQHLVERRMMLQEYFRMTIDEEGNLLTLPQILPSYKPEIGAMATFVLRFVLLPLPSLLPSSPSLPSSLSSLSPFLPPFLFLPSITEKRRLGTEVEWDEEQECFETLAREFAEFYCLQYEDDEGTCFPSFWCLNFVLLPSSFLIRIEPDSQVSSARSWTVEHVFFPAFRQRFLPPKSAAEDGTIVRIASLDKLYKVFERC
jgi:DNA mismatch repair protein MLH1